jgi:glycine dehydrogenase subunit 1
MNSYIASTREQQQEMLKVIGIKSFDDLFAQIPENLKINNLDIPSGMSEIEVMRKMEAIADKNILFKTIFRGAGAYRHYIPSIVKNVVAKEEFLTAYTPYQPEVSQGILQAIFEYQTMISNLTGMDVSNASVYDGATAAAEAVAMCRERSRTQTLISGTAHPDTIETIKTYCYAAESDAIIIPAKDGQTDLDALLPLVNEKTACVYIEQPNFYGIIEDVDKAVKITHDAGAKLIMGVNPIAMAVLKTPGEYGADIATGEGQPLGMPLAFGGPYLGFMAATTKMMRKVPGRIVGETVDIDGKRAYVLTLQAREQHIRREKASSNICSNQALCALTASVYLTAMGENGLREAALQSMSKAHYLAQELEKIGFKLKYDADFFHEFVTECPQDVQKIMSHLEENGILGGLPIEGGILWCATEMNTKEEIDTLIKLIREVCA